MQQVLVKREEENLYILHLLYASPVQRGGVCILEDFPAIRDVKVELNVPECLQSVRLIPQNEELSFRITDKGYIVIVPEVIAHQMLVISYESGE